MRIVQMASVGFCTMLCGSVYSQNFVNSDSWTVGSGSVGAFTQNGYDAQNIRELGIGPYGNQVVLWKAVADAAYSSDGGWDTGYFPIDPTKMYRFSVWIKKTNSTDGTTYFGCNADNIVSLAGALDTNPYFWSGDLPSLDKWYLLVGYVHASGDASTTSYGGIYDGETGAKIFATTDFKFSTTATQARHRTYLYYDTNVSDRQYFFGPEATVASQPVVESIRPVSTTSVAYFGNKVGIGTGNPSALLEVSGPYNGSTSQVILNSTSSNMELRFSYLGNTKGFVWYNQPNDQMAFGRGSVSTSLFVNASGNFGIGTTNPASYKLAVEGKIGAREVNVTTNAWSDYVFNADYKLRPLAEVQQYIEENHHLPEVPSEKEVLANGQNLGEMNAILLKKIEELTLYVMQLNKSLESAHSKIKELEEKKKN